MSNTPNRSRRPVSSSNNNGRSRTFSAVKRSTNSRTNRPQSNRFRRNNNPRSGRRNRRSSFDVSRYINRNPSAQSAEPVYQPQHTFGDFGFGATVMENINRSGLSSPTPIQDKIIPLIINGRDTVGIANTGTGKTAAFLLPLIELNLRNKDRQTLILTPTRELAIQIESELQKLTRGQKIYSTICIGGANIQNQIKSLRKTNHFIIGTPGRVLDLISRKVLKLEKINTAVLDEADRMLDMGFIKDIRSILSCTPDQKETHCFSATMPAEIERLIRDFLKQPTTISVKKQDISANIHQDVIRHRSENKFETLTELLNRPDFSRVLIFGEMKHGVEKLSRDLSRQGLSSASIHGNKSHPQRQRALQGFKNGSTSILVATDVAARGLHISEVSHVINYDLPSTYEDYIHRIGRTGRGNKYGQALTFVEGQK